MNVTSFFDQLINDDNSRFEQPLVFFFAFLGPYRTSAHDYRFVRNNLKLRTFFRKRYEDKMNDPTFQQTEHSDLMSMLMKNDYYKGKRELIIDDVFVMLLAGMKTI